MNEPNKKIPFAEPKPGSRRIVVMGGSFNPPTLAHLRLMRDAVDALGAEKGFSFPQTMLTLKGSAAAEAGKGGAAGGYAPGNARRHV